MKTAYNMPQTFEIVVPQGDSGTYTYSKDKQFSQRSKHNPWVWVHDEHEATSPHFTCWADDFDKGGFLTGFHISTDFDGHEGLHIYFKVSAGAVVTFSGVDAKRIGSDEQKARDYVYQKANKRYFVELAQEFIDQTVKD